MKKHHLYKIGQRLLKQAKAAPFDHCIISLSLLGACGTSLTLEHRGEKGDLCVTYTQKMDGKLDATLQYQCGRIHVDMPLEELSYEQLEMTTIAVNFGYWQKAILEWLKKDEEVW